MSERIAYAEASGKSQIISSAFITPETFDVSEAIDSERASKTGRKWRKNSEMTFYIYGLESLEVLEILRDEGAGESPSISIKTSSLSHFPKIGQPNGDPGDGVAI